MNFTIFIDYVSPVILLIGYELDAKNVGSPADTKRILIESLLHQFLLSFIIRNALRWLRISIAVSFFG